MSVVMIRPARTLDAGKLADIMSEANSRLTWLPKLYSGAEEIMLIGDMIEAGWVRTAYLDEELAGFIARKGTEIHALYLRPHLQGRGVARKLIVDAQRNAKKLGLWSYEENERASRFYGKAGFAEVSRTDGSGNDARLPDIRFEWLREAV
ncbi:GNAT family N-acetyltransferase [Sulfitobacter donghicola]|uniref:GNAT family acetyltransferase n=1 Tax=Sulfitobacter donghicola DSW-25 = KCTC 12864 = JCM 14565 TaxID=1300350 RepID=A0A073ICY4_9RHOB|nr:GNAT family N-acetyltransferase [Sulfitobacter donghicola]KEJ88208.1 GNAT family acetyltransferase [Sulfitobacter donghicola DSW-25 = KCTC 12864 = JCM 14565]KIN68801.1 Acetyltransferase, gnat family [Sulfitobacter donghicola DSW-25 = KCTC 12864 = JCM 14565]